MIVSDGFIIEDLTVHGLAQTKIGERATKRPSGEQCVDCCGDYLPDLVFTQEWAQVADRRGAMLILVVRRFDISVKFQSTSICRYNMERLTLSMHVPHRSCKLAQAKLA